MKDAEHFTCECFVPDGATSGYKEYAIDSLRRAVLDELYERFQFGKTYLVKTERIEERIDELSAQYFFTFGTAVYIVGYIQEVEE